MCGSICQYINEIVSGNHPPTHQPFEQPFHNYQGELSRLLLFINHIPILFTAVILTLPL